MEGMLAKAVDRSKVTNFLAQSRSRYFLLRKGDAVLSYWSEKFDPDALPSDQFPQPKDYIDMRNCVSVSGEGVQWPDVKQSHLHTFCITLTHDKKYPTGRKYFLGTNDKQQKQRWVTTLQKQFYHAMLRNNPTCHYSSERGVCRRLREKGHLYCQDHHCRGPGCTEKVSSRVSFCGKHAIYMEPVPLNG